MLQFYLHVPGESRQRPGLCGQPHSSDGCQSERHEPSISSRPTDLVSIATAVPSCRISLPRSILAGRSRSEANRWSPHFTELWSSTDCAQLRSKVRSETIAHWRTQAVTTAILRWAMEIADESEPLRRAASKRTPPAAKRKSPAQFCRVKIPNICL
jgi:hypothetical protein